MVKYISLHNHTSYSTLDGIGMPERWAKAAKELGYPALGLSDHGTISGAVDFYEACVAEGIRPIIGAELYVVEEPGVMERTKDNPEERYHVCVFAKNEEGFRSILALLNFGHKHFYHRPRVGIAQLIEAKGVVITTACHYGLVRMARIVDRTIIPRLAEAHKGDFYLEIQPHKDKEQKYLNEEVLRWSRSHKLPVIATGDCHYPLAPFGVTHEVLLSIQAKKTLEEYRAKPWFSTTDLYLMTGKLLRKRFISNHASLPTTFVERAMETTLDIAEKCSLELKEQPVIMPDVGGDAPKKMLALIQAGIKKKFPNGLPPEYKERVVYETGVIRKLGFINYFLVVHDILRFCRAKNIEYGPGRGSVGGSVVAWLMDIHKVDPIRFGLYFERFLNPERVAPPDIDLDFAQDRREEVVAYLRRRYGDDHVANISTFLRMKSKMAVKDVARVFGIPPAQSQELSNEVFDELGLRDSIAKSDRLQQFQKTEVGEQVLFHALALDGQQRGLGQHAAGVVVADRPLEEVAILESRSGIQVVNWDMGDAEKRGLLKIDVLGLRTCSVVNSTVDLLMQAGKKLPVDDVWMVPLDDEKVLAEFGKGNTAAVFQFEGRGIRDLLRSMAPINSFQDLSDATSLYRPGPKDSGLMELYVERRMGIESITYAHPSLEPILKATQGVIVFQEQVMRVAHDLAGYTWAQADSLRKVIAKKLGEEAIEKHRKPFVDGCIKKSGLARDLATSIFDQIHEFVRYSFNLAHSTEYSVISYVCMWLKVYYPTEFFCAMFRHTTDETRLKEYAAEARRLGVRILLPDLFKSASFSVVEGKAIRLGLNVIKGMGGVALQEVEANAPYTNLSDFFARTRRAKCNKSKVAALVAAGAIPADAPEVEQYVADVKDMEAARRKALGPFYNPRVHLKDLTPHREKIEQMFKIIKRCKKCDIPLYGGCRGVVPPFIGERARLVVVAEAPGEKENEARVPLVGKSGKELEAGLNLSKLERADVYITNVWLCRPANNRLPDPVPTECHQWLRHQMTALNPTVVVAIGKHSASFFGMKGSIVENSGRPFYCAEFDCWVLPIVHPGWAFRRGDAGRKLMKQSFKALKGMIKSGDI